MAKSNKSFQKTGNWTGIHNLIKWMDVDIRKANAQNLMKVGLYAERTAVMHLKHQDLGWQPLLPKTVKQKASKGWGNQMLIASTDYMQSITSYSTATTAFAGVRKRSRNREGQDLTMIAAVHEFGSGEIPPRPLWRPTFKETYEWIVTTKMFPKLIYEMWRRRL